MKQYDNYKESGIEWIGEIPSHWKVIPFKHCMAINNGRDYKSIQTEEGYPVMGSGGQFACASQFIYDGEVVLLGRKGTIDKPLYFNGRFWTVDTMFYAIPKRDFCCRFMYYLALTFPYDYYATSTALPSMTQSDLGSNPISVPNLMEQQSIANYLDAQCKKIDNVIAALQKRIELLQELKQSIITRAVTQGINPNVKLKDSEVEWINTIPQNWIIAPLKSIGTMFKGVTFTKAELVDEGTPVISYGQIHSKENKGTKLNESLIRYIPNSLIQNAHSSLVGKGDFIFADTSEDLEGSGNAVYIDKDCQIYGGYHTIVFRTESLQNKYFAYLFLTDSWRSQIRSRVSGVKVYSITQSILSTTKVIIPPPEEQQVISNYLDDKCDKIDSSIAKAHHQIDLLKEYKQSLITEVVTGKRKVC